RRQPLHLVHGTHPQVAFRHNSDEPPPANVSRLGEQHRFAHGSPAPQLPFRPGEIDRVITAPGLKPFRSAWPPCPVNRRNARAIWAVYQRGGQLARVLPDHAGQLVARGAGHGTDDCSGRISTTGHPGHVLTMRSASSRSGTSISVYPLTPSLPSTNGPSMRTGSPWSSRTVVAVSGDRSLPPPRIFAAWVANHSATRSYARSRPAGPMASRSLAYCSVSTNNSTYFNLAPLRTLSATRVAHGPTPWPARRQRWA